MYKYIYIHTHTSLSPVLGTWSDSQVPRKTMKSLIQIGQSTKPSLQTEHPGRASPGRSSSPHLLRRDEGRSPRLRLGRQAFDHLFKNHTLSSPLEDAIRVYLCRDKDSQMYCCIIYKIGIRTVVRSNAACLLVCLFGVCVCVMSDETG